MKVTVYAVSVSAMWLAACGAAAPMPSDRSSLPSPSPEGASVPASGGGSGPGIGSSPSPVQTPSAGAAASPVPTDARAGGGDAEPLARLTRSGGFIGETTTVEVLADGTVWNPAGGGPGPKLAPEPLRELREALGSPEWRALEGAYGEPVADGFEYTVEGGGKRVVTYDAAKRPPVLERVITILSGATGTGGS